MLLAGTCPRFSNNSRANVSAAVSLGAVPLAAVENLLVREARELADCGVGGHTIFAAVLLSYRQGDFLPQFRIEAAFGKRTVELNPGFQSRWGIRECFRQVRNGLDVVLKGGEQFF